MAGASPPAALSPNFWGARRCRRIGLLGGSFNPAHEGHRHVSLVALRELGLDEVWWLVSPQNPLKPVTDMAPFAQRLAGARAVTRHPRLRVSGIEERLGTRFTADTLRSLVRRFPGCRFVWLMGADNLRQIPEWDRWEQIFRTVPVAVFDRSPYAFKALAGIAARRFDHRRVSPRKFRAAGCKPVWTFLHIRLHPASATALRHGPAAPYHQP